MRQSGIGNHSLDVGLHNAQETHEQGSNGADYQYVMTLIATQSNKLSPVLGKYEREKLLPSLYSSMKEVGFEMTPYVYEKDIIPDSGIIDFLDNISSKILTISITEVDSIPDTL